MVGAFEQDMDIRSGGWGLAKVSDFGCIDKGIGALWIAEMLLVCKGFLETFELQSECDPCIRVQCKHAVTRWRAVRIAQTC